MNVSRNVVCRSLLLLFALISLGGCSKSATQSASGAAAAAPSGMSAAANAGMNLYNQLGGVQGVTQLASQFGVNLAANPMVAKFLDAASITQAKNGLVNEIAKASGMAAPNPGADLMGALSGKGLDAAGIGGVTQALSQAADQMKIGSTQKAALMGLIEPMAKTLAGQ
jgi:truncated hemoglobin YjbI